MRGFSGSAGPVLADCACPWLGVQARLLGPSFLQPGSSVQSEQASRAPGFPGQAENQFLSSANADASCISGRLGQTTEL